MTRITGRISYWTRRFQQQLIIKPQHNTRLIRLYFVTCYINQEDVSVSVSDCRCAGGGGNVDQWVTRQFQHNNAKQGHVETVSLLHILSTREHWQVDFLTAMCPDEYVLWSFRKKYDLILWTPKYVHQNSDPQYIWGCNNNAWGEVKIFVLSVVVALNLSYF